MSEAVNENVLGKTQQTQEGNAGDGAAQAQEKISNEAVRESALFKKVAAQVKERDAQLAALTGEREKATRDAEITKAQEEGRLKELLTAAERKYEDFAASHARDILQRDLQVALFLAGATNKTFIKGAIADFAGGAEEIEAYVAKIKDDPSNVANFVQAQQQAQRKHEPPGKATPGARAATGSLEDRMRAGDMDAMKAVFEQAMLEGPK